MARKDLSGERSHQGKLPKQFHPGYAPPLPLFQKSGSTKKTCTLQEMESLRSNTSGVSEKSSRVSTSPTVPDSIALLRANISSSMLSKFCDHCLRDPKVDRSSCANWDENFKLCGADFVDHLNAGRMKKAGTMKRRAGEMITREKNETLDRLAYYENPLEIPAELKNEFCVICLQDSLIDLDPQTCPGSTKLCGLGFIRSTELEKNHLIKMLADLKKRDTGEDVAPHSSSPATACHRDQSSPLLFELDLEEFKPVKEPLTWDNFKRALSDWCYGRKLERKTVLVSCGLLLMAIYGLRPRELFKIRWMDIWDKNYLFIGGRTKAKELTSFAQLVLKSLRTARRLGPDKAFGGDPIDRDEYRVFEFTARSLERYVKEILPPDHQFEDGSYKSDEKEMDPEELRERIDPGPVKRYFDYTPRDIQRLKSEVPEAATVSWVMVKALPGATGEEEYNPEREIGFCKD